MTTVFRMEAWAEGPEGSGQGGLASYWFSQAVGRDLSVRLHAPIPMLTDLEVAPPDDGSGYTVRSDGRVILSGAEVPMAAGPTPVVSVDAAAEARHRSPVSAGITGAPNCFSCGLHESSMGVHPGPLADGRYATDLTTPDWAVRGDGSVDPMIFWAALDCTAGFFVDNTPPAAGFIADGPTPAAGSTAVTAQYQVEMVGRVEPGRYALVGYDPPEGDPARPVGWDGRKRHACSAAFDEDGNLVARANSFWIAVDRSIQKATS